MKRFSPEADHMSEGTWSWLWSGHRDPAWNMAFDETLLEHCRETGPVLRFYGWTLPAATFGYFQKHSEIETWTTLRPLIRRPTGGGLVPHDADWTYTLVFPPGHEWYKFSAQESYERLHRWISSAFALLRLRTTLAPEPNKAAPGQCFAGPERHDLLLEGRKIAGAAQRRNRMGLLIQGSIQTHPRDLLREDWANAMLQSPPAGFSPTWTPFKPPDGFEERVQTLATEKYSTAAYNKRR